MPVASILTANQQAVFQALGETRSPLSAYAILERLKSKGIKAPLQVYRALEKLIEFGLVHRLESINAFVIAITMVTTPSTLSPLRSATLVGWSPSSRILRCKRV